MPDSPSDVEAQELFAPTEPLPAVVGDGGNNGENNRGNSAGENKTGKTTVAIKTGSDPFLSKELVKLPTHPADAKTLQKILMLRREAAEKHAAHAEKVGCCLVLFNSVV